MIGFQDDEHHLSGFVHCGNHGLDCFSIAKDPSDIQGRLDLSTLIVGTHICNILRNLSDTRIVERLQPFRTEQTFPAALQELVVTSLSSVQAHGRGNRDQIDEKYTRSIALFSGRIVQELGELGWEHVDTVSDDMRSIGLKVTDDSGRDHKFEVSIPPEYPTAVPSLSTNFPSQIELSWPSDGLGRLHDIVNVVKAEAEHHRQYFDVLDDIDETLWVLEPVKPTYNVETRRIAIEKTCSVIVQIDPRHPMRLGDLKFLGAPERVEAMRSAMIKNFDQWQTEATFRANLERILEVSMLRPSDKATEKFSMECAICYSYLEQREQSVKLQEGNASSVGDIPDTVCPNSKCGRAYHHSCLSDWLQSLPTCRNSFGTLFGACPYCQEPISTRL